MSSRCGFELLRCVAETWAGADDVQCRAAGAGVLARRRDELAGLDARDRGRKLPFELGDVRRAEGLRDDRVWTLEEVVDDLDLLRPAPEAGERVHETLHPFLARAGPARGSTRGG